ncbi:MAG: toprim domain-containing protein [Algoriphagus sp.]|uniref:toprim domain-containing protein n=1 Tax=Algoriphagus sp. TaxID=1872435 RepID=UPI002735EBAF|nr:toprim domain-containing protein [Algoriphagus sp.]MDP3471770.1 toprim domain-containing protein [Algoriphagus sp.]
MNYSEVKQAATKIKQEFPVLDYFHSLVKSGFLKYEGLYGKEFFFGFLHQRTGSIAVDDKANVWFDHAAGKGGDIIAAVQEFENKSFFESVESLSGSVPKREFVPRQKPEIAQKIVVEKVSEISHDALIQYIRGRGIDLQDIASFGKEVHWRNKGKRYFAVGFPNQSGGWVLRSPIFKGNILGGGISIQILGTVKSIKIFEGWFDFLSYLKLSGATDFKAIILNSTANLNMRLILDILKEMQKVELYLDNDATGETYTNGFIKVAKLYHYCLQNGLTTDWDLQALRGGKDKIGRLLKYLKIEYAIAVKIWRIDVEVFDQRGYYTGFEDLNELINR